jgi:hypothetical protein
MAFARAGRAAAMYDPLKRRTARSTEATSLTHLLQLLSDPADAERDFLIGTLRRGLL